jgi:hypothetical protein
MVKICEQLAVETQCVELQAVVSAIFGRNYFFQIEEENYSFLEIWEASSFDYTYYFCTFWLSIFFQT